MKRAPKIWPRVTIEIVTEAAELVEAALMEAGSLGNVTEDDETREIPEKTYEKTGISVISATFENADDIQHVVEATLARFLTAMGQVPEFSLNWDLLIEEDWDANFKASWKSLELGAGIHIVPSWEKAHFKRPEAAQVVVYLDPGMAFGTGHHETTSLCAQALVELWQKADAHYAPQVLDVGTGTAILAIIAAQLGANQVIGTEICDDAMAAAQENVEANNLSHKISVHKNEPDAFGRVFDLVVANILAQPLIELSPQIAAAMKERGQLILSGILATQALAVTNAYENCGLMHEKTETKGDWVAISFSK